MRHFLKLDYLTKTSILQDIQGFKAAVYLELIENLMKAAIYLE